MEHFIAAFSNFTNFRGRATRNQFWMFSLIYFGIAIGLSIIEGLMGIPGIASGLFGLVMLIPSIAYGARRLHDIGRSGWWQLLGLIPVIGLIILIVMFCLPGKDEAAAQFPLQAA